MVKAGKKRRDRRQKNEHDPCETGTSTNLLSKKRSVRWRQRLQIVLMQYYRPWANLPSAALLTIFRRIDLEERFRTIPLVCKSWRTVSQHPQCWSSMIPDSMSPELAFIHQWCASFLLKCNINSHHDGHVAAAKLTLPEQLMHQVAVGVSRLETLITKSGGGGAITSLYLSPFISHNYIKINMDDDYEIFSNTDRVLRIVADCCPNLKHISFYGCFPVSCVMGPVDVSEEALIELITKCQRLELIDFDIIRCTQYSSSFMQKLANCLPHLRGIRIQTKVWHRSCPLAHDIAKYLPRLKLLNLARTRVNSDELSSILSGCRQLQYLNIEGSAILNTYGYGYDPYTDRSIRDRGLVYKASAQIPYFYFGLGNRCRCTCSTCMPYDMWDVIRTTTDVLLFDWEEFGEQFTTFGEYAYYLQYFCQHEETYRYQGREDQYYSLKDGRSSKRISQRKWGLRQSTIDQVKKNLSKENLGAKLGCQRCRRSKVRRRQLGILDGRKTKFYGLQ